VPFFYGVRLFTARWFVCVLVSFFLLNCVVKCDMVGAERLWDTNEGRVRTILLSCKVVVSCNWTSIARIVSAWRVIAVCRLSSVLQPVICSPQGNWLDSTHYFAASFSPRPRRLLLEFASKRKLQYFYFDNFFGRPPWNSLLTYLLVVIGFIWAAEQ